MAEFTCMYYERAMPSEFCDYIVKAVDWAGSLPGEVHQEADRDYTNFRKVKIVSDHLMSPLGSICKNYLVDANTKGKWSESICDFDIPQILKYETDDHYWWHTDVLPPRNGMERRASLCMLLNDPSEFEGGELQIKNKTDNALKNKGDIIIFDSTVRHRVAPVTKGVRISAVCWAYGFCKD
jgi:Rps23 Pro-64 3,4-dihydroxylase Tpa1-like proline 4-hydroxylase